MSRHVYVDFIDIRMVSSYINVEQQLQGKGQLFSSFASTSIPPVPPMPTQRIPIFAQENFLLPILTHKLLMLECAGILGKWSKSLEAIKTNHLVKEGIELAANYGIPVGRQLHRISLPLIYGDLNPPKEDNNAEPLSMGFMIGPFEVLGFGLCGTVVAFFGELVRVRMKRRRDGRKVGSMGV